MINDYISSIEANLRKLKIRNILQQPPLLEFDPNKLPKNIRYGISLFNHYGCLTGSTVLKGYGLIDRDTQDIDILVDRKMFDDLKKHYQTHMYTRRYNKNFKGYVGTITYQMSILEAIKVLGFVDFIKCLMYENTKNIIQIDMILPNDDITINSNTIDNYENIIKNKIDNHLNFEYSSYKNRLDIENLYYKLNNIKY